MPGRGSEGPLIWPGVVEADRWDARTYRGLVESSEPMQAFPRQHADVPHAEAALADLWAGLFKIDPRLREEVPPSFEPVKRVWEYARSLPEWEETRSWTRLDEAASALAALDVGERVLRELPEAIKEQMRQAEAAEREAEEAREEREGLEALAEALAGGNPEGARQASERAAEAAAREKVALERAARAMAGLELPRSVKAAIRQGVAEAGRKGKLLEAFGWGREPGRGVRADPKEVLRAAERLKGLQPVAELAGRMLPLALEKRQRKLSGRPEELVGVRSGAGMERLLPSELAALGHPVLRLDFLRRLAEGGLLAYEVADEEERGQGPVVVILDTSGSMQHVFVWAQAVALALYRLARKERRAYALFHFGSASELRLALRVARGEEPSPSGVAEAFTAGFGGGTDFERPLDAAAKVIEEEGEFRDGDVVMITDGQAGLSPDFRERFLARKEALGFELIAVLLGGAGTVLEEVADRMVAASPDLEGAGLVFEAL